MELSGLYNVQNLKSFQRKLVSDMLALEVELEDYFESEQPISIEESFMSTIKPELMEDGRIRLPGQKGQAVISYDTSMFEIRVEQLNTQNIRREKVVAYRIGLKTNHESVKHKLLFHIMYEIWK